MSDDVLVADAQDATGDSILAAGTFQPKGMSGTAIGGFASGTGIGSAVGESITGTGMGEAADSEPFHDRAEGLTPVVAVSESKIYVLRSEDGELTPVHTFHRGIAHISVHSRIGVRTLEIVDPETRQHVELEAERGFGRSREVIDLLVHG